MQRRIAAVFMVLVVTAGLWAREPILAPGDSIRGQVNVAGDGLLAYQLRIPDDAFFVEFALSGVQADLDLLLYDRHGDLVMYSETTDTNEVLRWDRLYDPPLVGGEYTIEVVYQLMNAPRIEGRTQYLIPFALDYRVVRVESQELVRQPQTITLDLDPDTGMFAAFAVQPPVGAEAIRIDVVDADVDVDLFVNFAHPVLDPYEATHQSSTYRSREWIVVPEFGRLQAGRYHVMAVDQIGGEIGEEITIAVSFAREPNPELEAVPTLPRVTGALDRALLATVEVTGADGSGSGTVVSPSGYVLTNYHVVRRPDGEPSSEVSVAFSLDHARPPKELFMARVVAADRERDLALLQIDRTFYGSPLPRNYVFPHIEMDRSSLPSIASAVMVIGYPAVGGSGSRVSVSVSRGIVAGYERVPWGTIVKTDAEINSGSSGGAALDENYRLIGVPTSVIGQDAGQLGYLHPVQAIPEDWLEQID